MTKPKYELKITVYGDTLEEARRKMVSMLEAELRKLTGSRRLKNRGERRCEK